MKDLKHEHQSTFPLWGRVKLNFRDRYRKLNVFSKNSSRYQLFLSNSQKLSLWCKTKMKQPHGHMSTKWAPHHWGGIQCDGGITWGVPIT